MTRNNAAHRFAKPAFLAVSCVGAFATYPAFAASDPDPVPANDDEDDQDRRDILITGQKIKDQPGPKDVAPIVDTPKSIIVLDKSVIEQTGSSSLQDALRTVPGITFGAAEGGNPIGDRPFIRGFDSQGSIYVDGVRDLASQNREVFAIDSVQIIRGSDSTLGGRGSAGGTINIISRLPVAGTFGSVSGSYGNGDYKRVSGDLNVQVAPNVAFRLQGVWHDQDVVGRDAIYNRRWGFAPSVTIGLGTPTRLTASYYYLESHELPDSGLPYLYVCSATVCNAPTGNTFTTPVLGNVTTAGGQTGFVRRSTFYGLINRDFRDTTSQQATLRVEHDFGGITLRNTSRFTNDDQAYSFLLPDDSQGNVFGTAAVNPVPPSAAGIRGDVLTGGLVWRRANTRYGYTRTLTNQTDLYGIFKTGSIEHSFAIGTELSWEKTRRGAFVLATGSTVNPRCNTATIARYYCTSLFNPNPNDPFVNYASDTSSVVTPIVKGASNTETQNDANTVSVYGFDSITLLPSLILNLGGRFDRFTSTIIPPFAAGGTAFRFKRTDELFNWQAGLVFKPTKDTSIYASYATAATPPNSLLGEGREDNALPTTVATASVLDLLKVQKAKSYEVGAKASLFGDKLSLAAAAFETKIENARVLDANNNPTFIGSTRIRGFELSASGVILEGWTVFGGYTYLDPKIVDGGFAALTAPAITQTVGNVTTTIQPARTVLVPSVNTGKQVPQTAKNSFTFTTNYQVTKQFSLGGSAIYTDRQYGGYADNRTATQTNAGVVTVAPATKFLSRGIPNYWRFDAQARFAFTKNIAVSVNAQNLTNKTYFSNVYTNHYATIAPGRTVFGTVEFQILSKTASHSAVDPTARIPDDPGERAAFLRALAQDGEAEAQALYGQLLLDGNGVARDEAAGFAWFNRAAAQGHLMGLNMVGRCYDLGWGVAVDKARAAECYRVAAERGLDWAMYNYATLLALGEGVAEDRPAALSLFRKAARMGNAKAMNFVGSFHEDGWVVARDLAKAARHYARAAAGGDFRGCFNHARMLGDKGRADEALTWIERAGATATPAFVAKAAAFLDASPVPAFRARGRAAIERGAARC